MASGAINNNIKITDTDKFSLSQLSWNTSSGGNGKYWTSINLSDVNVSGTVLAVNILDFNSYLLDTHVVPYIGGSPNTEFRLLSNVNTFPSNSKLSFRVIWI